MLACYTSRGARHYALNWFNCLIVCPFRAKSGKYYSRKHGKLMELGKEMTVIALGFYLIKGKLRLLQTSVNMLWSMFKQLWPTCSIPLKYLCPNPMVFPRPLNIRGGRCRGKASKGRGALMRGDIDIMGGPNFDSNLSINWKYCYCYWPYLSDSSAVALMLQLSLHP